MPCRPTRGSIAPARLSATVADSGLGRLVEFLGGLPPRDDLTTRLVVGPADVSHEFQ
jgi:hypothetical protein